MIIYHNRYIPTRNVFFFVVETSGFFLSIFFSCWILYGNITNEILDMRDILYRGMIIAIFGQFCMYILDFYDLNVSFSIYEIMLSSLFTTGFLFIIVGLFGLVIPDLRIAGEIYYVTGAFVFLFIFLWRVFLERIFFKYSPVHNIVILGAGDIAFELSYLIRNSKRMGFNLVGLFNTMAEKADEGRISDINIFPIGKLIDIVVKKGIKKVIVAPQERRNNIPVKELLQLRIKGLQIIEWPTFYEQLAGKIPVKNLPPSYFVFNEGFEVSRISELASGLISMIAVIAALSLFAPFLLIIYLVIKLDSDGPGFYKQERVGRDGRLFKLLKFRTMVNDAEKAGGAVWAEENDTRITRVGRYLRRYRLDEVPQMINVLKGEMNLVGPRPERPEFVKILENEIPYYGLRHSVKPGVTGWAQVKFCYSGTLEESREKLEYDLYYIKNRTSRLDCYILFKTIKVLLLGRGAR